MAGVRCSGPNQDSADKARSRDYPTVPGLGCPQVIVNDAVIAHRGALGGRAGVIVVAGTGSMILAITERDEEIESGHFQHYAGGARHLVFDVIERLLTIRPFPTEDPLAAAVLRYWEAADVGELRRKLLRTAGSDRGTLERRNGDLAPAATALADTSMIADAAVRALTFKTAQGIRILTPLIADQTTPVALAGALVRSCPAGRSAKHSPNVLRPRSVRARPQPHHARLNGRLSRNRAWPVVLACGNSWADSRHTVDRRVRLIPSLRPS